MEEGRTRNKVYLILLLYWICSQNLQDLTYMEIRTKLEEEKKISLNNYLFFFSDQRLKNAIIRFFSMAWKERYTQLTTKYASLKKSLLLIDRPTITRHKCFWCVSHGTLEAVPWHYFYIKDRFHKTKHSISFIKLMITDKLWYIFAAVKSYLAWKFRIYRVLIQ